MQLNKTVFSPLKSLEGLSRMFPVQGAVVVGAGIGTGAWFDLFHQQNTEDVLLIDAEPSNVRHLEKKYASHSRWSFLQYVVGDQDGERTFYSVSNSAESTLLSPDVLKTLWPNISVREERVCQSVTLAWLAHEKIMNGNWLVIDVFPALCILNGALKTLSAFDVIIVRQLIDEHPPDGLQQDIGTFMQQHGFCCFGIEQELHPSLGHAVYVRDGRELALDLKQIQEQSEKLQKDWLDRQSAWELEKVDLLKARKDAEQQVVASDQRLAELTEILQVAQQELTESKHERQEFAERLKQEVEEKEVQWVEKQKSWAQEKNELLAEWEIFQKQSMLKADMLSKQIDGLKKTVHQLQEELAQTKKMLDASEQSNANLRQSNEKNENLLRQQEVKEKCLEVELEKKAERKNNGDANIDDMLHDLAPFFSGKMINYVDVGAYTGEVFRKIYDSKKIRVREAHLYEPNPVSYEKLIENVGRADLRSLHTYNVAIGAQSGNRQFSAAGTMTKMLNLDIDKDNASNIFSVDVVSLDELGGTYTDRHIDLLKIDVEGTELDVLEGAQNLLCEQQIDIINVEVGFNRQGTQQTYFAKVDEKLQEFGYRVFRIYEQKNEWMRDSPLLRRCNFVYMSSRFADANPLKKTQELVKLQKEAAELKQKLSACQARFEAGDK